MRNFPYSLTLLVLLACGEDPVALEPAPQPETQTPRALRLDCLTFNSSIVFEALPDSPQSLEAIYQGSERAYWRFGNPADPNSGRRLRYRSGQAFYGIEPGSPDSEEFAGATREVALLQFELRRALMLWPDGFAWRETDRGFEHELAEGIGRLFVEAERGEPIRFYARNREGVELESYSELTWQDAHGRRFPESAVLSVTGNKVWSETITSIAPGCEYVSFFFIPPDRRSSSNVNEGQTGAIRHVDLPRRFTRSIAIDSKLSWSEIRIRAVSEVSEARKLFIDHNERLDFAVVLNSKAEPTTILLQLDATRAQPSAEALDGWRETPRSPAVTVLISTPDKLTPGMLQGLSRYLPEGARGGQTTLRIPLEEGTGLPFQIVLRCEPE